MDNHEKNFSDDKIILWEKAYKNVLGYPYNSITPVYHIAGESVDPAFGDNCIWQAEAIKARIEALGCLDAYYVNDNRHHAAVAMNGANVYYFDPYLMHIHPIILANVLASEGRSMDFPAYPVINQKMSSLTVTFTHSDSSFRVKKTRYDYAKGFQCISTFNLDLKCRKTGRPHPSDQTIAFAAEQNSLSIRFLDKETGTLTHLVYPIAETHPYKLVTCSKLYTKNNFGYVSHKGEIGYSDEMSAVSGNFGLPISEIEDFVMHGVELYERFAPKDIQYYSTNPTNQ